MLYREIYDSVWSATDHCRTHRQMYPVSIHALRVECDQRAYYVDIRYFMFQSTHSVWSATYYASLSGTPFRVSIHALRVECDKCPRAGTHTPGGFNPRTPCGVRPALALTLSTTTQFQSTHSVWSATLGVVHVGGDKGVSIHALRVECDCRRRRLPRPSACFNPRTPCGVRQLKLNGSKRSHGVSIHALRVECDCL